MKTGLTRLPVLFRVKAVKAISQFCLTKIEQIIISLNGLADGYAQPL